MHVLFFSNSDECVTSCQQDATCTAVAFNSISSECLKDDSEIIPDTLYISKEGVGSAVSRRKRSYFGRPFIFVQERQKTKNSPKLCILMYVMHVLDC